MWVYKGVELGVDTITGVPPTDLTDEEFTEYSKMIDTKFTEQGSLERCGLWEHVTDQKFVKLEKTDKLEDFREKVVEEEKKDE